MTYIIIISYLLPLLVVGAAACDMNSWLMSFQWEPKFPDDHRQVCS